MAVTSRKEKWIKNNYTEYHISIAVEDDPLNNNNAIAIFAQ